VIEPWEQFPLPPEQRAKIVEYLDACLMESAQRAVQLERESQQLRDIIAALVIKYATKAFATNAYRAVLNPDVLGSVESSLLLIDKSVPGMVTIRYGAFQD